MGKGGVTDGGGARARCVEVRPTGSGPVRLRAADAARSQRHRLVGQRGQSSRPGAARLVESIGPDRRGLRVSGVRGLAARSAGGAVPAAPTPPLPPAPHPQSDPPHNPPPPPPPNHPLP